MCVCDMCVCDVCCVSTLFCVCLQKQLAKAASLEKCLHSPCTCNRRWVWFINRLYAGIVIIICLSFSCMVSESVRMVWTEYLGENLA